MTICHNVDREKETRTEIKEGDRTGLVIYVQ